MLCTTAQDPPASYHDPCSSSMTTSALNARARSSSGTSSIRCSMAALSQRPPSSKPRGTPSTSRAAGESHGQCRVALAEGPVQRGLKLSVSASSRPIHSVSVCVRRCGLRVSARATKCRQWRSRTSESRSSDSSRSRAYARTVSSISSRPDSRRRRFFSTSPSRTSTSAPVTSSAASTVAPPAKTAKRANASASGALSRRWLHSSVARSVAAARGVPRTASKRVERAGRAGRPAPRGRARPCAPRRARPRAAARRRGGTRSRSLGVGGSQLEGRVPALGALHEQGAGGRLCDRLGSTVLGHIQRAHGIALLGLELKCLSAGYQHAEARTAGQQIAHEWSGREDCSKLSSTRIPRFEPRKR